MLKSSRLSSSISCRKCLKVRIKSCLILLKASKKLVIIKKWSLQLNPWIKLYPKNTLLFMRHWLISLIMEIFHLRSKLNSFSFQDKGINILIQFGKFTKLWKTHWTCLILSSYFSMLRKNQREKKKRNHKNLLDLRSECQFQFNKRLKSKLRKRKSKKWSRKSLALQSKRCFAKENCNKALSNCKKGNFAS